MKHFSDNSDSKNFTNVVAENLLFAHTTMCKDKFKKNSNHIPPSFYISKVYSRNRRNTQSMLSRQLLFAYISCLKIKNAKKILRYKSLSILNCQDQNRQLSNWIVRKKFSNSQQFQTMDMFSNIRDFFNNFQN